MIYVTSLITSRIGEAICGVSKTITGAVDVISQLVPVQPSFEIASETPTRILLRHHEKRDMFFMIRIMDRMMPEGKAWVITKRLPNHAEDLWAIFKTEKEAKEFINANLDIREEKKNCRSYEFIGVRPFSSIVDENNPELSLTTYCLYEMEVVE